MSNDRALQTVLELRQRQEDESLRMWTDAKNAVISFEKQIEQLNQFEKIYTDEMQLKSQQGLALNMYSTYQQFIEKLDKIRTRQIAGLEQLKAQMERARLNYLEKQKQRKIIEKLIEKHRLEKIKLEAKAEQKLADELTSSKQARILIEKMRGS
ncbi:MAG: flagellar export protein FliJ [Succinivibrio sp.]